MSTKERPILFKGAMVRAILDGTKTQTRRIVKPQPETNSHGLLVWSRGGNGGQLSDDNFRDLIPAHCPQGKPGDRLWVKETHAYFDADPENAGVVYRESENGRTWEAEDEGWKWRPSLFMPRKWSRITLEVVSVRVERLKDISDADALAEGVEKCTSDIEAVRDRLVNGSIHCDRYACLWESINGPGSWELNPWVWVISFKRIEP